MTAILGVLFFIVGALTFGVLVYYGRTERHDIVGWVGATLCTVGGLMTVIGYSFEVGIGVPGENARQVATFVSVLFTLCASTFGVMWWLKRHPKSEPETAQAPRTNYIHAYGTYDANTVRDARAQAQQLRRGARA